LEEVGIPSGDYMVRINNRKILNGVLELIGLDDQTKRLEVLRVIDKFDKVGVSGVAELLSVGRLDASGAYIDGVGLSKDQAAPVLAFLTAKGDTNEKTLLNLREVVGNSVTGSEGIAELDMMAELFTIGDYSSKRVQLDPSVVRGLEYYTGPVFEAELTFEIYDTKGKKRQFGSVAGGGRYDDLVKRFTGQTIPATGVSIGVDRLMAALREKDRSRTETIGPVVVTVMDRERLNDYLSIVSELRSSGIRAEMYLGNPKNFGNQLRYADKRRSPLAIIEGSEERDKGLIQIKDLILGTQLAKNATLEEWKERPSQFTVPKKEMVSKVQEMLRALKK
jgi:histidyl-tRNA synthetase